MGRTLTLEVLVGSRYTISFSAAVELVSFVLAVVKEIFFNVKGVTVVSAFFTYSGF